MVRLLLLVACALPASCGGGGGGSATTPVAADARLAAESIEIGAGAAFADVTVTLASAPAEGTTLLQVDVVLPPQLTLPASERLQPARPLVTLDGDAVDGTFRVICGDASNGATAANLALGPLFRLRIAPALPRQPGTWRVDLRNLRASTRGGAAVPVDTNPTIVDVTVR
jgi:hypothetical protein